MNFNELLFILFAVSFGLSIVDKMTGEKLKIGSKAEEGFVIMAKAIFSMSGILYLYPFLSSLLIYPSKFIANLVGSDPAILISCFLPIDIGGYHISLKISNNEAAKLVGGVLLSSTFGATLGFTYPVAFGILKKGDWNDFVKGSLIGIISIPLSIFATSLIFRINAIEVLKLMGLVIAIALILIIGVTLDWTPVLNFMKYLGKFMGTLNLIGLLLLGIEILTGKSFLPNKNGLGECIKLPLKMAILIAGSYTFFYIVYSILLKSFSGIKSRLGINERGLEGILILLTNCVPTLYIYDKMNYKAKIVSAALCIGTASIVGPQLGFIGVVNPSLVYMFITNKLLSGLFSIIGVWVYCKYKDIKS